MPTLLRVRGYRFFFFSMERGSRRTSTSLMPDGMQSFGLIPYRSPMWGFRANEMTDIRRIVIENARFSGRDGMSTLTEKSEALAVEVSCSRDALSVTLTDGRVVSVPLVWFPRLADASPRQRSTWELIGGGGIHREAIDEEISVASLLHPENFFRLPGKPLLPSSRAGRSMAGSRRKGAVRG